MIARLQRVVTFLLLFASLSWMALLTGAGYPSIALLGACLILFGYAVFLVAEFAAVFFVQDSALALRATPGELVRAWCGEVIASPQVFFWRQPFRANAELDRLPACPDGRRGVLLVHGFVCNRGFWNPWMTRLRRADISFIAINLEPPFGSIGAHAPSIERAVVRLTSATGAPPLIVAHSMGGLAVRHWCAAASAQARVHRIITIGTPHRGTWLARFSRTLPGIEMALDSSWLRRLNEKAPSADGDHSWFTCFYGNADNVVFPASCATLPDADNRLVRATAHVKLAFHPQVFDEALRCLT